MKPERQAQIHQLDAPAGTCRDSAASARAARRSARRCAPPGGRSRPASARPSRRCCPRACSAPRRRGWRTARSAPDAAGPSARRRRARRCSNARICRDRPFAQVAGIRLADGVAQPRQQLQQRRRGRDQRVDCRRDRLSAPSPDARRRRRWRRGARRRLADRRAGRRPARRRRPRRRPEPAG